MQSIGGGDAYQPEWQAPQPREEPLKQAPTLNQPSQFYQQQYQQPGRYQQPSPQQQHQQYQPQYHEQYPNKPQQQYQQQPQNQPQPQRQMTPSGWSSQERPQPKQEFAYSKPTEVGVGHDEQATTAIPVYQKQFESYHKQQQQQQQQHYYYEEQQQQTKQYQQQVLASGHRNLLLTCFEPIKSSVACFRVVFSISL